MKNPEKPEIDYFNQIFDNFIKKINLAKAFSMSEFLNNENFNETQKRFIEMQEKIKKNPEIGKVFAKKLNKFLSRKEIKSNIKKKKDIVAFYQKLLEAHETHEIRKRTGSVLLTEDMPEFSGKYHSKESWPIKDKAYYSFVHDK